MTASHNPGHGTKEDIKGRESRLGATKSPRFPTLDGRPRRPILPFWQSWTQFGSSPRRGPWRPLSAKYLSVSVGLPVDRIWKGGSDLQASVEIYHWGYPRFLLILSSQNDPLLGPQFQPPDAEDSEGTRLGDGSKRFVREGHRVSCLVPTSGRSGRGINFGVFRANISLG